MSDIRKILEAVNPADSPVSGELLPLLYDELRDLAAGYMAREKSGQTLQATALVHEAWLRLSQEDGRVWNNRVHFFRAAAQAMRRILVERARAKGRIKRGASARMENIDDFDLAEATTDRRVLLVDEMLDRLALDDPECARIVALKFFGGLGNKEIAAMEGMGERTVERQWAFAKAELYRMIREEFSKKG